MADNDKQTETRSSQKLELPQWAWLLAAGAVLYVWTQSQFPSRLEENLKHGTISEQLNKNDSESRNRDNEIDQKLNRLADLVSDHVKTSSHTGTTITLNDHAIRIVTLEETQKKINERLETNEQLLRDIKASLDNKRGRQ